MFAKHIFLYTLLFFTLASSTMASISNDEEESIEIFLDNFLEEGKPEEARAFLDRLERKYLPEALYLKGVAYLNGLYNDGERNPREATIYFAKAAVLKYAPALTALADSYLDGDGTAQDEKEAFRLYKQAADLGDGTAQFNVAILYRDGVGVKKSKRMALQYMKKAAANNDLEHIRDDIFEIIEDIKDEQAQK
jgi:TPR repeat protein